jgi:diguanylate cyclase (GGDEF)-like protein/PAS domain S-box-containing protein
MAFEGDIHQILDHMYDRLYVVDRERKIQFWNRAAERITGYRAGEITGTCCADNVLIHVDDAGCSLCEGGCPLSATMADGRSRDAEIYLRHKEGHRIPAAVRVTPMTDETGAIVGGIELFSDISSRAALRLRIVELEKLALVDELTGLPNRRWLETQLDQRRQELVEHGVPFGVLFLDIDHFKAVNDTHGHGAGDRVLATVAETLLATARVFDSVGRWGGEEFIGVFPNVDLESLTRIAERMRALVGATLVPLNGSDLSITASVGGTLAQPQDSRATLIERADRAMYRAKRDGRNRVTMEDIKPLV